MLVQREACRAECAILSASRRHDSIERQDRRQAFVREIAVICPEKRRTTHRTLWARRKVLTSSAADFEGLTVRNAS